MGVEYEGINVDDEISFETLRGLCPLEAEALEDTLDEFDLSIEDLGMAFGMYDGKSYVKHIIAVNAPDEVKDVKAYAKQGANEIVGAYKALQDAFATATTVGDDHLDIFISFDCPDDITDLDDGEVRSYWEIDGMFQLSPAGRLFAEKVKRATAVSSS